MVAKHVLTAKSAISDFKFRISQVSALLAASTGSRSMFIMKGVISNCFGTRCVTACTVVDGLRICNPNLTSFFSYLIKISRCTLGYLYNPNSTVFAFGLNSICLGAIFAGPSITKSFLDTPLYLCRRAINLCLFWAIVPF